MSRPAPAREAAASRCAHEGPDPQALPVAENPSASERRVAHAHPVAGEPRQELEGVPPVEVARERLRRRLDGRAGDVAAEPRLVADTADVPRRRREPGSAPPTRRRRRPQRARRAARRCGSCAGRVYALRVRILLVSQMYPGPEDPDLGVFVQQLEQELRRRGNELELRGSGPPRGRQAATRAARAEDDRRGAAVQARRRLRALPRPDRAWSARSARARRSSSPPTDATSATSARSPASRAATRLVARRATAIVAVSDYLRRELEAKVPEARGKVEVVDCGVDLERFAVAAAPEGPTAFLCVGALTERKNVAPPRRRVRPAG